jgi:hypothetical protein
MPDMQAQSSSGTIVVHDAGRPRFRVIESFSEGKRQNQALNEDG